MFSTSTFSIQPTRHININLHLCVFYNNYNLPFNIMHFICSYLGTSRNALLILNNVWFVSFFSAGKYYFLIPSLSFIIIIIKKRDRSCIYNHMWKQLCFSKNRSISLKLSSFSILSFWEIRSYDLKGLHNCSFSRKVDVQNNCTHIKCRK